jgi:hypothetical protein
MTTDTFRRIEPPGIAEFYTVTIQPANVPEEELPIALIMPHYDVQDAFGPDGAALESAEVGAYTTSQVDWLYERVLDEKLSFPLEAVDAARLVNPDEVRVFGTFGTGRSFSLASADEPRVLRRGTAAIERSPGQPFMLLQDNGANFRKLLERQQVPNEPPDFRRPLLAVRLVNEGGDVLLPVDVQATLSLGTDRTIVVYGDMTFGRMFSGQQDTRRATNIDYELVLRPRTVDVSNARQRAAAALACAEYTGGIEIPLTRPQVIEEPDLFRFFVVGVGNISLQFSNTTGPLDVSVTNSGRTITIDLGDEGPVQVSALNAAIVAAYAGSVPAGYFDEAYTSTLDATNVSGTFNTFSMAVTVTARVVNTDPLFSGQVRVTPPGNTLVPAVVTSGSSGGIFGLGLPGRNGLILPGLTAADLAASLTDASNYGQARPQVGMQSDPYRLQLPVEVQSDPSAWMLLTPAETNPATFLTEYDPAVLPPARIIALAEIRYRTPGPVGNQFSIRIESSMQDGIRIEDDGSLVIEDNGGSLRDLAQRLEGTAYELTNVRALRPIGSGDNFEVMVPMEDPDDWPGAEIAHFPFQEEGTRVRSGGSVGQYREIPNFSAREVQLQGGSNRARLLLSRDELVSPANGINIRLLADYRALRIDTSAATTVTAFGRAPDFIPVNRSNYQAIAGRPSLRNPMAFELEQFFRVAPAATINILSVSEVSSAFPYGTPAAISEALSLLERRRPYFLGMAAHGQDIQNAVYDWLISLGGDVPSRLRKMVNVFLPVKNPTDEPVIQLTDGVAASVDLSEFDDLPSTLVVSNVDIADDVRLSAVLEAGRLVLVATQFPTASDAPVALSDGRRGWPVLGTGLLGNPFAFMVGGASASFYLSSFGDFTLVDRGESLVTPTGGYRSAEGARALAMREQQTPHKFLSKILGDTVTVTSAGRTVTVPHELVVIAQVLAMLAVMPGDRTRSLTDNVFPGINRYTGTSDIYDADGLNIIRGAGVIIPVQPGGPNTPVDLSRDLTSDVTNTYTQKRAAHVLDHLLSLRIRRRVRPLLGPNDITPQLLDTIGIAINTEIDALRDRYEILSLRTIRPVTAEDRARYGVQDTGVYVALERKHREEASVMILENFIV